VVSVEWLIPPELSVHRDTAANHLSDQVFQIVGTLRGDAQRIHIFAPFVPSRFTVDEQDETLAEERAYSERASAHVGALPHTRVARVRTAPPPEHPSPQTPPPL
jgi:hypothetical protein